VVDGADAAGGPTLMKRVAAPAMVTCWLLGLFWVVLYYMFQDDLPLVGDLGGWNLVIGMGFIAVGFRVRHPMGVTLRHTAK
jgi:hypothetical protein